MFWKLAKKPEAIELVPNSYAVVHLDDLNNHRNVLALIHLSRNSQITGVQFFTSENTQVVCNIRDVLSKCCDGKSFKHTSLVRFIDFSKEIKVGAQKQWSQGKVTTKINTVEPHLTAISVIRSPSLLQPFFFGQAKQPNISL